MMNPQNRTNAIDAADLLNDLVGDIITGVMVFREYNQQYRSGNIPLIMMSPIQKMCLSHIMLSLTKWVEIHKNTIPSFLRQL